MTFCLISASLGREIGGQSQFLGKFAAGLTLKCAIKNGVNVVRLDELLREGGQKTILRAQFGEDSSLFCSGLRNLRQVIVVVEFTWLRMIRQASDS